MVKLVKEIINDLINQLEQENRTLVKEIELYKFILYSLSFNAEDVKMLRAFRDKMDASECEPRTTPIDKFLDNLIVDKANKLDEEEEEEEDEEEKLEV